MLSTSLRPRDQQKYSALVTTSSEGTPKVWKLSKLLIACLPLNSPAPIELKESPVEMQVETEDLKESPIVNDQ